MGHYFTYFGGLGKPQPASSLLGLQRANLSSPLLGKWGFDMRFEALGLGFRVEMSGTQRAHDCEILCVYIYIYSQSD